MIKKIADNGFCVIVGRAADIDKSACRQKGGTPEILDELEAGMKNYAALCGFLNATLKSGIDTVLDLIDFDGLLEGTDLVVTGEGRIDWQSAFGKVPSGIGQRCKAKGILAVAIVGGMGQGAEKIFEFGIDSILPTINGAMDIEEACNSAQELYAGAAERMFRLVKVGMSLKA